MPQRSVREQLVKAAMRRFHRSGFRACTIEDIADEAGVFKGSFYNHFKSKEALAVAIVRLYREGGLATLDFEGPSSPLKRLRSHFEQLIALQVEHHFFQGCLLANFSAEMADANSDLQAAVNEAIETWCLGIAKLLAQAKDEGEIGKHHEVNRLARFVINAWEGAAIRVRALKSRSPLEDFLKVTFEDILTKRSE